MSLLKKVFITIFLAAVLAIGALLYLGLSYLRYGVSDATSTQQLLLAKQTIRSVDRVLAERYRQIGFVGEDEVLETALLNPKNTKMQQAAFDRALLLSRNTGPWDELRTLRPDGIVVTSLNLAEVGTVYNLNYPPVATVFQQAANGDVAYSDVFADPETKKPEMLFAAPVRDTDKLDKPVIGVVLARLSWSVVLDVLQNSAERDVALYDSHGVKVADSVPDHESAALVESAPPSAAVQRALSGNEGSMVIPSGQDKVFATFVNEPGDKQYLGNRWVLVIQTPVGVIFGLTNQLAARLPLIFTGVAFVTIAVVMLALNRIVVRRVKTLTEATEKIAVGDFEQYVDVRGRDEVGQLGNSFNKMAAKLQDIYHGLESKVAEKAFDLAMKVQDSKTGWARDEAILAGIGDALTALDQSGRVVLVNAQACELYGVPREVLIGYTLNESLGALLDLQDNPVPYETLPETIASVTGKQVNQVYHYRRSDGKRLTLNIHAAPVVADGEHKGVVLITRDITKEDELAQAKNNFITLASSHLRTPLAAIKWFGEMLLSGKAGQLTAQQRNIAVNVYDSTAHMIQLVNSLLSMSQIETGSIILNPEMTDFTQLVESISQDLRLKTDTKKQTFVVSAHKDLPTLNIDKQLIGQAYLNLLTNAINYTAEGGEITVIISKKGNEIITQITDNGIGIPTAEQPKVFDKFFRCQSAIQLQKEGAGLGLYIARSIIEASGGRIWFKSEEDKGTTFWFTLPVLPPKSPEEKDLAKNVLHD